MRHVVKSLCTALTTPFSVYCLPQRKGHIGSLLLALDLYLLL